MLELSINKVKKMAMFSRKSNCKSCCKIL